MAIDVLSRAGYPPIVTADETWMDRVVSFQVEGAAASIEVLSPDSIPVLIPLTDKTSANSSGAERVFYAAIDDDDELIYSASGPVNRPKTKARRVAWRTLAKHAQEIVKGDFGLDLVDLAKAGWTR